MALSSRFQDALVLAAQLHADQVRKGTEISYISHLLIVAGVALEHGASEDEAIAALLHDAVEDQGGSRTYELIRERFGQNVADIVAGRSDTDQTPKPPWKERKLDYLKHLRSAAPSVRLVSAADKLHNATAILADYQTEGESLWSRFNGGKEGTLWYYRALTDWNVKTFRPAWPMPINLSVMSGLSRSQHSNRLREDPVTLTLFLRNAIVKGA